ncbi:MAG: hypothetical protein EON58_15435 [Alphaproteobacteria bacterium]|nr:MAG: hypothetical protein EON58_15435 [Alphaproteobacteria bacterium]
MAAIPQSLTKRLATAPDGTGEKALQAMAWLCDDQEIREDKGNNKDSGGWIARFLKNLGLDPGQPWCAASLWWCCVQAKCARPPTGGASVYEWVQWAKREGRLLTEPKRGCAVARLIGRKGHMGICRAYRKPEVDSIEGNTSAGVTGSQRDGGGMYRRTRPKRSWGYFIDLDVRP